MPSRQHYVTCLAIALLGVVVVGCGRAKPTTPSESASLGAQMPVAAATPAPASTADPRLAKAIALADRVLSEPTPMQVNRLRGAVTPGFDRERYLDDPAAYLDYADENRALYPAPPSRDALPISAVGGTGYGIKPGESVTLRCRTDPGMPVNFASFGFGRFASGSQAISVAANAEGIASAVFTATPGAVYQINIQASSPVRPNTINFLVQVDP